jgi:GH15 family glucan-1,4-alpha-glucosidase
MATPIADYGLISDCQGSALVSRSGSIDWACLPRFDSPSVFCRLLGPAGGHWQIGPVGPAKVERSYLPDTMVLRTVFRTETGVVTVTDALALSRDERGHQIGKHAPHVIVRVVQCAEGEVDIEFELAPRAEYGLTVPVFMPIEGGVRSRGGPLSYLVSSPTALDADDGTVRATFRLTSGESHCSAMHVASPWAQPAEPWSANQIKDAIDSTIAAWRSWSGLHQSYDGPYADLVRHSGRVLQALTFAPTGAVVAAPTTSLPEELGGVRNWDYRFCWVRDASLTLSALWVAACPDEANQFFDFLATAAGGDVAHRNTLQILYGIGGERFVPEHELDHLPGYADSRPVRIGNGAWDQSQLDVYGELLDAAFIMKDQVGTFDPTTAAFLIAVADTAASRWDEPDQGIWEVRGGPRHFVYSKVMCWVALDCAILIAEKIGATDRVEEWTKRRDEIRSAIEERGWSERAGAYTQSFDSDDLDAANLMMPIVGFLPATDPRMRATIEAIAERLTDERGFVYRYRAADGLEGEEGSFAICTFWLVNCLAKAGEVGRARELFERLTGFANDVGLMSEEIDASSGELLGNFPQAFTHIGLVNAAWAISVAEGTAGVEGVAPVSRQP